MPSQYTVLLVPLPELTPLVQDFRARHIHFPSAHLPPHVTLHSPPVPTAELDERVWRSLDALASKHPAFDVRLGRLGRFDPPGVLWLEPMPSEPFAALARAIAAAFPQHPPLLPDPVFHLTVAQPCTGPELERLEREFARECPELPHSARAREVARYEKRDGSFHHLRAFPLRGARAR